MFPILFHIGEVAVHSYGFFIAVGYIIALIVMLRAGRADGISNSNIVDMTFFSLLTGIIGARILFVLTNISYFWKFPIEALYLWQGGLVFYGGLATAIPFLFFYIKKNALPRKKVFDVLCLGLTIGHAFGRIGCLGAGCCHGSLCNLPWAIQIHSGLVDPLLIDSPIHPTQAYESIALFLLFFVLFWIRKRRSFDGQIAVVYLIAYSLIRIFVEYFRGDSIRGFLIPQILSTSQAISILVFFYSLWLYREWSKGSVTS